MIRQSLILVLESDCLSHTKLQILAKNFTSLYFHFAICEMGMIIVCTI